MEYRKIMSYDEIMEGEDEAEADPGDNTAGQDALERYAQIEMPKKGHNPRGNIWYLPIIGHIEGHMVMPANNKTTKYEHVIPLLLNAAESTEVDGLLVVLNTVGGDVEAGLAIAELIANIGKPTVSLVLGGGHSIGVPLACAAAHSFIARSASMTVHPVRVNGTVVGAQQTYDHFNKMQERIVDFIVQNSQISRERLQKLMMDTGQMALDVGTFIIGEEAVREGLIDGVGGLNCAMEKLYSMIESEKDSQSSA
ncbi:MAG: ATP-dependent Clp protease proteolytic subunit [Defluviitaleaceae bacterium]|nr:ATP-dependent Clp protease proteolytic subunit [Defluviitaleaceae bacterium]